MAGKSKTPSPCGGPDHDPRRPENRAGLSQITYRITTQPEAFDRMLWRLPRHKVTDPETGDTLYPLDRLRTRDLADPTISLIDAYAMACDVVSFYSERIAQEGYLGTAMQRRSVLELARMIGYELAPGVAAGTHLAFTVEDSDDPYRTVEIGAGVQAMSIPHKKDAMPQIFETVEKITARAEWNDIHARTERPQNLVLYNNLADEEDVINGTLYLFDLDNSFGEEALIDPDLVTITNEAGLGNYHPLTRRLDLPAALTERIKDHDTNPEIDPLLYALPVNEVCLSGLGLNLRPGTRMLAVGQGSQDGDPVTAIPLRVVSAIEDRAFKITKVLVTRNGTAPEKVRRAPPFRLPMLLVGTMPTERLPLDTKTLELNVRGKSWSGDGLSALVQSQSWQRTKIMTLIRLIVLPPPEEDDGDDVALGLHVMRDSSGFFGSTAPLWLTLDFSNGSKGPYDRNWDGGTGPLEGTPNTIWMDAKGDLYPGPAQAYLDREVKELQPNSWAIIENEKGGSLGLRVTHVALESRADYAITGKTTGVGFHTANNEALELGEEVSTNIYNSFRVRSTQIYAVSQFLPLSGVPLSSDLQQGVTSVELDRLYLDLERGRPVSLSGARRDAEGITGRETHFISEVQHIDGITRLLLMDETTYPYDRTTVRINANVALATHGEKVVEDLGSGDARLSHQTFTLKKPPLTFVSAANETGRASTLEIRVDGALWSEVPALGQAGPEDAVYEVRQSDDGKTHVRFGDGVTGRRLPTGALNVKAVYRSGIGFPGEVPEEAISQLKTRPLGVRAVVNPSPATGAADPESMDSAKLNAPGTVKTLGRIVSLTDYEDFAGAFAGVGKAQARELWSGQEKVVHLTVAPEGDAELTESDTLIVNLSDAIERVRDPARPVIVQPYQRCFFTLTARLEIDPAYLAEDVVLWARQLLEQLFGYDTRKLAQSVSAAEVISALHTARGVLSTDLDALAILLDGRVIDTSGTPLQAVLPALPALGPGQRGTSNVFSAAELLTVLPSAITLTTMEAANA
jgi:hypothetical protein